MPSLKWHSKRAQAGGGPQDLVAKLEYDAMREVPRYCGYDPDGAKYLVRYIIVDEKTQRTAFERHAIAEFDPPFCTALRVPRTPASP